MAIKLNTGKEAFPIEFDNGDKVEIYFNPNDPDLSIRMRDFQKNVEARTDFYNDMALDADGKPVDVSAIDKFEEMRNIVCEELDRAFNGDISSKVFKHCSPFAIVEGNYFMLQFIEAIRPEIEKRVKKANEQTNKNMQKYLKKYGK